MPGDSCEKKHDEIQRKEHSFEDCFEGKAGEAVVFPCLAINATGISQPAVG